MLPVSQLQGDGVQYCQSLLNKKDIDYPYQQMLSAIEQCAKEFKCSLQVYLTSISRWASPSPVTDPFVALANSSIHAQLEALMDRKIILKKMNIICKNKYAKKAVPCHQDISYQSKTKYHFSCWMALNDIGTEDGPLACLPKSHLAPIRPAVDFWEINFFDTIAQSVLWKQDSISYAINTGDAILFDAATVHGSEASRSTHNRYALVTRWEIVGNDYQSDIPGLRPGKFGMWTCHQQTVSLLTALLKLHKIKPSVDFVTLLDQVNVLLPLILWLKNKDKISNAINQVKILHMASKYHNAGDAHGWVYKDLWVIFLSHIQHIINKGKV
jgi:hypothetical protein